MWHRATATLDRRLHGDAGPCQMLDCDNRATVSVAWLINGYGYAASWYCDTHAPPEMMEQEQ